MKYLAFIFSCSLSLLYSSEINSDLDSFIDLNSNVSCAPENRIISKEDRIKSNQCKVNKLILKKYKKYLTELLEHNRKNIEFIPSNKNIKHPTLEIEKIESNIEEASPPDPEDLYKLNALKALLPNFKFWPVSFVHSIYDDLVSKYEDQDLNSAEIEELYFENKKLYLNYKKLNERYNTNKFYTISLFFQKIGNFDFLDENSEDPLLIPLKDYSKFHKDFYNEYFSKYSYYIKSKNSFNARRALLRGDDFAPFIEIELLQDKKEKFNNGQIDIDDEEFSEITSRLKALYKITNLIRIYLPKTFNSSVFNKSINQVLRSGYNRAQVTNIMNKNWNSREKYRKYKSQYWFEFYNYRYFVYREALRRSR